MELSCRDSSVKSMNGLTDYNTGFIAKPEQITIGNDTAKLCSAHTNSIQSQLPISQSQESVIR